MMLVVSSVSAFLNNTPIVAFMIPYVKDWAEKTGNSSSKFLIPLSFATILGGMITVIGTSTNLVLNGLVAEYNLPLLAFTDFLYLGIIVTIVGCFYLYFIGFKLLPSHEENIDTVRQNLKEYIVETSIYQGSPLIGKTVRDAGLRSLQDTFLVEILRDDEIISPVAPDEILEENDLLLISEFNSIISTEINAQPAPFIYERIGEKFKHYFIDEFQDTSQMQWKNLIPLIDNKLSSEDMKGDTGSAMLVGDAKQAIYRWRGGKAEQFIDLYTKKDKPFVFEQDVRNLPENYRP